MNAFLYGVVLQCKLDIRSRTLLITCYVVPLLFFAIMGGIFTSINPQAKATLIQSMSVMGVSAGALVGLPPSLVEIYAGDIKKVYKANGVPLYLGMITMFLSAFTHLMIMCGIIYIIAPIAFDAKAPDNLLLYFTAMAIYISASLSVGCVLGIALKNQAKLTMVSQLIFLPSIMLSGIMFPVDLLPRIFEIIGKMFPASWGYRLITDSSLGLGNLFPLLTVFIASAAICGFVLDRLKSA